MWLIKSYLADVMEVPSRDVTLRLWAGSVIIEVVIKAQVGYGPIQLWPYTVMALYSYGPM